MLQNLGLDLKRRVNLHIKENVMIIMSGYIASNKMVITKFQNVSIFQVILNFLM